MSCVICGHDFWSIDENGICSSCDLKLDWEENQACRRCYVNERDPRSRQELCNVCQQQIDNLQDKS